MCYSGVLLLVLFSFPLIDAWAANRTTEEMAESNSIVQVTLSEPSGPDSLRVVNIYCKMYPNAKPKLDTIYNTYRIGQANFHNCPPGSRYSDILTGLDVNLRILEKISLKNVPRAPVLEARHFEGLNSLKKLTVQGVGAGVRPHRDFVKDLIALEELRVTNLELGSLPEGNEIEVLYLGQGTSLGPLGGCKELLWLTLENWTLPEEQGWLRNCVNLDVLKIYSMPSTLVEQVLSSIPSVLELHIKNCTLNTLTKDLLSSAVKMNALLIINSSLEHIENDAFENHLDTLEELDLCYNNLTHDIFEALKSLKTLRRLALCNNRMKSFCQHFPNDLKSTLTSLFLRKCGLTSLCFDDLLSLNTLDVEGNNITLLDFDKLPLETTRVFPLDVKMRKNPINNMSFSETLYHSLDSYKKRTQENPFAIITVDASHCPSGSYWLLQALQENFIAADGLKCEQVNVENRSGTAETVYPTRSVGLPGLPDPPTEKYAGKPRYPCDQCLCEGSGNYIKAYCTNADRIPKIKGLRELYAEGNDIQNIQLEDITFELRFMDLRYNSISRIETPILKEIFKWPRRKILLAGNPIACDCNNIEMLAELSNYAKQVDYKNIFCKESRKWLKRIDLDDLCKVPDGAVSITLSTLVLASAVFVMVIKYVN